MGLAASQARLLSITARKSDCEFQSMRLSHEKIALARDMEHISDEYQDALGKTKLVYDYYGSGADQQNLTYNLLMRPSLYNDYYPKLITDKSNRVVLDSKYAAAAIAAGIPVEGLAGTPSDSVRNAFIQALAEQGIITRQTAASIQNVTYGNTIGIGSTFTINGSTKEITWAELENILRANDPKSTGYGLQYGSTDLYNFNYANSYTDYPAVILRDGDDNITSWYYGGKEGSTNGIPSFSILDLLTGDVQYNLAAQSQHGEMTPIVEAAMLQKMLVGDGENDSSFLNYLVEVFGSILGGVPSNDRALQYAYDQIYNLLYPNNDLQVAAQWIHDNIPDEDDLDEETELKDNPTGKSFRDIMDAVGSKNGNADDSNGSWGKIKSKDKDSNDYIGFTYGASNKGNDDDGNDHSWVTINLNNIAKAFLTAFMEYTQGVGATDYNYSKGKISNGKKFYEPKADDKFLMNDTSQVSTGDEDLLAGFYDAMFNIICMNGWVKNEQISDPSYMQEQMKNGAIFISSISNDGFYYQGNYTTDNYIVEVPDQEAIAQAEAKYNSEKAKIQSKEDTLDVKMKNLDTEISSLTTEYDTTKNIINKAIEKSFKRYEA